MSTIYCNFCGPTNHPEGMCVKNYKFLKHCITNMQQIRCKKCGKYCKKSDIKLDCKYHEIELLCCCNICKKDGHIPEDCI